MSNRADRLQKLYFRIGEVAGIVGVEPHVLRYWESEFRSVRPQKSARGQRIYSRRDVDTLLKVKELLYSHRFTIAGAKRKLREGGIEPLVLRPEEAGGPDSVAPLSSAPPSAQSSGPQSTLPQSGPLSATHSLAPQALPPPRDLTEVRALRDRLQALRTKARAFLDDVDRWGEDEPAGS